MKDAARKLDFERAAALRDRLKEIKGKVLEFGLQTSPAPSKSKKKASRAGGKK